MLQCSPMCCILCKAVTESPTSDPVEEKIRVQGPKLAAHNCYPDKRCLPQLHEPWASLFLATRLHGGSFFLDLYGFLDLHGSSSKW